MKRKSSTFHSLSRRVVMQFCVFTFVLCGVYGLIAFALMYTLEDSFIERDIQQEAAYLRAQYLQNGQWPAPRKSNMQLHFSKSSLPDDVREKSIAEPKRIEFYGQSGRHYHLYRFSDYQNTYLLAEASEDLQVRPIRQGVMQFFLINTLVITLIACLIAWLIGRKTTRPLKKLAELVESAAPAQIPDKFAHQFPNNEIGILATSLEQSLQRINQALEREKCFTRDVSHELRSPLAIIKNAAELLGNQRSGQPALQRIAEAAEHMDKTVHTLLILAREEHVQSASTRLNLRTVAERSALDHKALLEGKPVTISDNCNTEVLTQSGMLKVLLDNLLSNAFQYTAKGAVNIDFENNTLTISDTGAGIESAIANQITETAIKGTQSTGFGFGLSIVKRLCEHQGWQLEVQSNNGTVVSVIFT